VVIEGNRIVNVVVVGSANSPIKEDGTNKLKTVVVKSI